MLSPNLSPAQRRLYRLYIPLAVAALSAGVIASPSVYHAAEKNYGCASADTPPGLGAVAGALAARNALGLESSGGLDNALVTAARGAQIEYIATHDGAWPQPNNDVTACVRHNPLDPAGWNNSGWVVSVAIQEAPPLPGS